MKERLLQRSCTMLLGQILLMIFREALTTTLSIDNFKFSIHILAEVILV
jgi:hypothetical protein